MHAGSAIVAILFYKGEPVAYEELAALSSVSTEEVRREVEVLQPALQNLGLTLVMTDASVELRTNAEASALIDAMRKEELSRDLGKAALETLSILMYKGPATRAEIEYIRGVNSTAILRNLQIRGLVEKASNPNDQRSYLYKPTHDLLAHLGVSSTSDMTEYAAIKAELEAFNAKTEAEPAS